MCDKNTLITHLRECREMDGDERQHHIGMLSETEGARVDGLTAMFVFHICAIARRDARHETKHAEHAAEAHIWRIATARRMTIIGALAVAAFAVAFAALTKGVNQISQIYGDGNAPAQTSTSTPNITMPLNFGGSGE